MLFNIRFLVLIFQSCGLDVENAALPSKPLWVQKSLPEEWPERGIDSDESGGIHLEWEDNSAEDIYAYDIYRATWYDIEDSLGDYELLIHLETESLASQEYLDNSAKTRIRYYYKLKSFDSSGNASDFSALQIYRLLPAISLNTMVPNGFNTFLEEDRKLLWSYLYIIEMEEYCITVVTQEHDLITRNIFPPSSYVSSGEIWKIPSNIALENGIIYKWRIDTGSNMGDSIRQAGSESAWASFRYEQ